MPEAEEALKDSPKSGIYTVLLILSGCFTLAAILFMHNELTEDYYYDQKIEVATKLTKRNREDNRPPEAFTNLIEVTQEDMDEYAKLPDRIDGKEVKQKPPKGPVLTPDKLPEIERQALGKAAEAAPAPAPANP